MTTGSKKELQFSRNKVIAGSCAIAISLGLARFDFGIIARLMQKTGWIATTGIGDLAGFNVAGYVIGCIHHSRSRSPQRSFKILALALFVLLITLWLESYQSSFPIRIILRFSNGWAAGHLVSGIPGLALKGIPKQQSRRYTSLLMSGAGIGALLGALAIGTIAADSPHMAWIVISASATLLAFPVAWLLKSSSKKSDEKILPSKTTPTITTNKKTTNQTWKLAGLAAGYSLIGAGMVPVVLYGPLIANERLGATPTLSSDSFALFGIGSVFGCFIASTLPRGWSTSNLLPVTSLIGLLGSILFRVADYLYIEMLAIFLVGSWAYMTVTLTYDRLGELLDDSQKNRWWALISSFLGISYSGFALIFSHLAGVSINRLLSVGIAIMICQLFMELLQRSGTGFGRETTQ